jgi:serine/threonine protein kinase
MYAIKTITPSGQTMSTNHTTAGSSEIGTTTTTIMTASTGGEDDNHLYGGLRRSSKLSILLPPNPRGCSPSRRRKSKSRINVLDMTAIDDNEDSHNKLDTFLEGSAHRNDGALRRMLREVFALAALCQLSDFRTFYIVRYNQAWLEDDGALYIQTELCTATLRDEMMMIGNNTEMYDSILGTPTTFLRIDVFRQMKILREILLALELVHQRGMVHLDIKPDNIFRKNDVYKLGDFGLAHAFSSTMRNGGQTDIISDVEEGDSRYMSKDLLDFGPKDLTKVNCTPELVASFSLCKISQTRYFFVFFIFFTTV